MLFVLEDVGARDYQEDRHAIFFNIFNDINYYGVFDGHGDEKVAVFMKLYFKDILVSELSKGDVNGKSIPECLFLSFQRLQTLLPKSIATYAGTTALVLLHHKDMLYVANVGDSRAILCNGKRAIGITEDHKPSAKKELERIQSVGGSVTIDPYGVPRVNGSLALSRAIGDLYLAPAVSWVPDIYTIKLESMSKYVVAASDGLWDVFDNQEVVNHLNGFLSDVKLQANPKSVLSSACISLLKKARERRSGDNITILMLVII